MKNKIENHVGKGGVRKASDADAAEYHAEVKEERRLKAEELRKEEGKNKKPVTELPGKASDAAKNSGKEGKR